MTSDANISGVVAGDEVENFPWDLMTSSLSSEFSSTYIPMAGENPPMTRMEAIIAARYAPILLPQPLNDLPIDGYLKQLPKFTGEGDIAT